MGKQKYDKHTRRRCSKFSESATRGRTNAGAVFGGTTEFLLRDENERFDRRYKRSILLIRIFCYEELLFQ